jgi:hypothetical protein
MPFLSKQNEVFSIISNRQIPFEFLTYRGFYKINFKKAFWRTVDLYFSDLASTHSPFMILSFVIKLQRWYPGKRNKTLSAYGIQEATEWLLFLVNYSAYGSIATLPKL